MYLIKVYIGLVFLINKTLLLLLLLLIIRLIIQIIMIIYFIFYFRFIYENNTVLIIGEFIKLNTITNGASSHLIFIYFLLKK